MVSIAGDAETVLHAIAALLDTDAGEAVARASGFVGKNPESIAARRLMARGLRHQGRIAEAEIVELQAVAVGLGRPAVAGAESALAEDRLEDAEQLIRPYLRENPEDAGAALILGTVAERCEAFREAENLYRRAVLLVPAYAEARVALAKLFNTQGRHDEALEMLDAALSRDPSHLTALTHKAALLVKLRRLDDAGVVYRQMLHAHPREARGWMHYGFLLKTVGQRDEAIRAYRKSVAIEPQNGVAWFGMSNLKTLKFEPDEIARMREVIERDGLSDEDRIHLHFALGKALGDDGEHAEAFRHIELGSAIRSAGAPHDPERVHANVLKVEKVFTPDFLAARAGAGSPARDPIFVVSMPRSGSTLVEQILGSHPLIEGTEELHDIERIAAELAPGTPPGGYLDAIGALTPAQLRERGDHYIEATRRHRHTDRPYFTDKMPSNWVFAGLIHLILPNAKIVDVRRHPLGCGFANFAQHYNWGLNFSYDLNHIGRFYADYVRQMAHFDRVLPGRVHRVIYEDLVEDPEQEVRRLLDYLELPFDEACLRFHENKRAVHTPSSEQVRQPINRDGMDRWRAYEPWLDPLKRALGPVLADYPRAPDRWDD
ncbi:tetratricopeptide repeat-containing sulfotransferase family protein [Sphingomonas sp.]|uniref:tetratricopeptide repeat-containing sulfotransferase family protein n=1 Tax=Sphingomonas sp. TaxID=28214 RepID=UPI001B23150A|nr:tetratricopeptide repeat-containing sulfotransferase family protein [Sphingomonas sp.]MBO9712871.1 sulfotransferase [Sphingomonas sp.]